MGEKRNKARQLTPVSVTESPNSLSNRIPVTHTHTHSHSLSLSLSLSLSPCNHSGSSWNFLAWYSWEPGSKAQAKNYTHMQGLHVTHFMCSTRPTHRSWLKLKWAVEELPSAAVFSALVAKQIYSDMVQFELSRRGSDSCVNGEIQFFLTWINFNLTI